MPSDRVLSYALREFAHTLVPGVSIQAIADHLVERTVSILPVTAAAVSVTAPGSNLRVTAASNDWAVRLLDLQTELDEGPGATAQRTGRRVAVDDLASPTWFPGFAARATDIGLGSVFSFPLRNGLDQLGALDLYRTAPGHLDATTLGAAQTLADVAAAYVRNAQAHLDLRKHADIARGLARHDALTALPNRVVLFEQLDRAIRRYRRTGGVFAALVVDLDRFKSINYVYGHGVGDQLLVAAARRIATAVRPNDTLARMSSDEFVILCEDLDGHSDAEMRAAADEIAARIGAAMAMPFALSDGVVTITASVGIAFSSRDAKTAEQLLHDADAAMYQVKRRGGGRHQVIDLGEQHRVDEGMRLERDLHGASARGELRTEYQPIVETRSGRLASVEALVRWAHPSRGLVSPTTMVPLAERSGLITEIGQWVLERSCADRRGWSPLDGADNLSMSVNVSPHQLMAPHYAPTVAAVLAAGRTDPHTVTLEVTESVFVQESKRAIVVLDELKELGVTLALDDFGTGYSSLNYLKRFPIDIVKIDQSFVADLGLDRASDAIVAAIVDLAHRLGMTVVAEGVETAEQHERLKTLECDACQGYYFARPISAQGLESLIARSMHDPHLPALTTNA